MTYDYAHTQSGYLAHIVPRDDREEAALCGRTPKGPQALWRHQARPGWASCRCWRCEKIAEERGIEAK